MKGGDFSWPPVGTFRGHQRGPQLATSGYFLMATDTSSLLFFGVTCHLLLLVSWHRVVRNQARRSARRGEG